MEPVTYNSYVCFAAAYPVVVDGVVRLYYFGGDGPHSGDRNSSFAMATMRMDGFAGLSNQRKGDKGTAQTFALAVRGKYLRVTADVDARAEDGSVKVGIEGQKGYALDDADAVKKNVTDFVVSWKGNADVGALMGQKVVLQFELNDATLYTFEFANSSAHLNS